MSFVKFELVPILIGLAFVVFPFFVHGQISPALLWYPSSNLPKWLIGSITDGCAQYSSNVLTSTGSACGSGSGGGVASSSPFDSGELAFVASDGTLQSVATGTLTTSATGLEFNATRGLVGGAAILALTSGYTIPLSASTTNWNTFYDTPSNRITAGNQLFWNGNTLYASVATATALTANGANASAGNAILGVDQNGAAEGAFDVWTEAENTAAAYISNITGENIFDLSDVLGTSAASGTLLLSDGTNFNARATSTLGFVDTNTTYTAGDALTLTGTDFDFDGGTAPGGELGGTWGSPSIDDSLAVTSWNLTTPTLTSFFGTPCTGNEFLQDISDTGAFTCAEAAGGAGSTSGGWATTTATTTQPAEVVTYTATDILSGGSAYNTAEIVMDHNKPFILLSTTTLATTTVMNLDGTQTISLGIGTTTDHTTDPTFTKWFDLVYATTNQVIMMARTGVTTFVHDFAVIFNSTATFLSTITFDSETFDSLTDDATLANNAGDLQVVDVTCTDCLNATEIEDIYLLDDGDTGTGVYDFGGTTSFEITNGTGPTVDAAGEIAVDTTAGQLKWFDGRNTHIVTGTTTKSFNIASTTADGSGNMFNSATTTFVLSNFPDPITLLSWYCQATTTGSVSVRFGDGTNWTNSSSCSTGGSTVATSNNTFTAYEQFLVQIGTAASNPNRVTITTNYGMTAQ